MQPHWCCRTAGTQDWPDRRRCEAPLAKLDALIAPDAQPENLGNNMLGWAEGPVWVKSRGYLLFSDVPRQHDVSLAPGKGIDVFLKPSGKPGEDPQLREAGSNGLTIDADGSLVMADSGDRALARLDLGSKEKMIFLDRYQGKRFNSPNDVIIAKSGAMYFTDPPYGLKDVEKSTIKELPFSGVFHRAPDGTVGVIDDTFLYPNGIALSPDESTLYVSNTDGKQPIIRALRAGAGWQAEIVVDFLRCPASRRADAPGMPDGMKIDRGRQPLCFRPRRHSRHFTRRRASRHDLHRRHDRQLRLWRGWAFSVSHVPQKRLSHPRSCNRPRLVTRV